IDDVLIRGGWRSLAAVTALLMLAMVIRVALSSLGNVVSTLAVQHTVFRARTKIVRHVQSLSASFHARRSVGELVQCLDRDVMIVGELGSDIFPALARTVVGLAMSVGVMVYLDWRIASIIVPLLPCLAYVRLRYRSTLQRAADAVRQTTGRTSSLLHEILTGVVQIQLLGAERRLTRRYARLSLRTAHEVILQRRQLLIFNVAAMSVTAIGVALIIGYGGARVLAGSLTIGDVVAFYGCVAAVFAPMTSAIDMFGRMDKIRASLRRLVEIEETPDVVDEASGVMPPLGVPRALSCRSVSFEYGTGRPVLHDVEFAARVGERIAVVGESGCGKSSLLKLIPRLYEPTAGQLTLDGRDVRSIPLRSLRNAISLVPQEPVLFQGTLRENLRYAAPDATADEIEEAAWIACLTPVIERLPHGWATQLGPMGGGLSGGEKQRLSITRALLQRRPILILDEATSALDDATEHQL